MNYSITAAVFVLYMTFIVIYFFRSRNYVRACKYTAVHLVICYAACLILISLLPEEKTGVRYNFIPFINLLKKTDEGRVFDSVNFFGYLLHSVLNIILYLPLGAAVAVHCRLSGVRKYNLAAVGIGFAVCLLLELLQLAINAGRIFDIDDLIFKTVGALTGCAAMRSAFRLRPVDSFMRALRSEDGLKQE